MSIVNTKQPKVIKKGVKVNNNHIQQKQVICFHKLCKTKNIQPKQSQTNKNGKYRCIKPHKNTNEQLIAVGTSKDPERDQ